MSWTPKLTVDLESNPSLAIRVNMPGLEEACTDYDTCVAAPRGKHANHSFDLNVSYASALAAVLCIVLFFNDMDQVEAVLFFNNMAQNSFVSKQVCKGKEVGVQKCNIKNFFDTNKFRAKKILYIKSETLVLRKTKRMAHYRRSNQGSSRVAALMDLPLHCVEASLFVDTWEGAAEEFCEQFCEEFCDASVL